MLDLLRGGRGLPTRFPSLSVIGIECPIASRQRSNSELERDSMLQLLRGAKDSEDVGAV